MRSPLTLVHGLPPPSVTVLAARPALTHFGTGPTEPQVPSDPDRIFPHFGPIAKEKQLEVVKEKQPEVGKEKQSEVGKETQPEVGKEKQPAVGKEKQPEVGREKQPEVEKETQPEVVKRHDKPRL